MRAGSGLSTEQFSKAGPPRTTTRSIGSTEKPNEMNWGTADSPEKKNIPIKQHVNKSLKMMA